MKKTLAVLGVLGIACAASAAPYSGAAVSVCDIASSDVPGPQPIRAFPVPAAAGWASSTLIYDNYAEGLGFSAGHCYDEFNWVSMPLGNANVTIHRLMGDQSPSRVPAADQWYTNEEGDDADPDADNRFPYHIPRPGQFCSYFSQVQFELASPTDMFGVFIPAHSNCWEVGACLDDHNFVKQPNTYHVYVHGAGDDLEDWTLAQYEVVDFNMDPAGGGSYCPFLTVQSNGITPIAAVSVIHDLGDYAPTFAFMDIYVPEPSCFVLLALGVLGLRRRSRA